MTDDQPRHVRAIGGLDAKLTDIMLDVEQRQAAINEIDTEDTTAITEARRAIQSRLALVQHLVQRKSAVERGLKLIARLDAEIAEADTAFREIEQRVRTEDRGPLLAAASREELTNASEKVRRLRGQRVRAEDKLAKAINNAFAELT